MIPDIHARDCQRTSIELIVRKINVRLHFDLRSLPRALSSKPLSPRFRRPALVFLREAGRLTPCRHGYLFPVSRDHENR